jgi:hypothetical protein
VKREYRYDAVDGKEMTIAELRVVFNDTSDLSPDCKVKARITMAGTIKSITVIEER